MALALAFSSLPIVPQPVKSSPFLAPEQPLVEFGATVTRESVGEVVPRHEVVSRASVCFLFVSGSMNPTYFGERLGAPDLTAEHLDGLYRDLSRGKGTPSGRALAPSTVGQVHSTARVALGRAAKKGVISHNVALDADPPRVVKKERPTLDLGGLKRFFGTANGERLEALCIVWCLTGLRPGEILGLKWADVRLPKDGSDHELLIRRSWSATRVGAVMRETTKTGKGRPVSLLPEATAALSAHRTRYLEELVRYRALWGGGVGEEPRVPGSGLPLEGRHPARPRQREPPAVQAPLEESRTAADAPLRHPPLLRDALDRVGGVRRGPPEGLGPLLDHGTFSSRSTHLPTLTCQAPRQDSSSEDFRRFRASLSRRSRRFLSASRTSSSRCSRHCSISG